MLFNDSAKLLSEYQSKSLNCIDVVSITTMSPCCTNVGRSFILHV